MVIIFGATGFIGLYTVKKFIDEGIDVIGTGRNDVVGEKIEEMGYGNLPICIAKTQYSLSDDVKNLECDEPFEINVRDVELKAGAGFIVVLAGKIMTMPGLPKIPAAESIDIDENRKITGIF